MALAYEGNIDLAFDTGILRKAADNYQKIAVDLRNMAEKLDSLLATLKDSGWTTPAGTAFYNMTNTNWEKNIKKYADLLDTLKDILIKTAMEYETLIIDYARNTTVKGI